MPFTVENFHSLASLAVKHNASDIHIREDETPCLRIRGDLVPVHSKSFTHDECLDICKLLFRDDELYNNLKNLNEWDGSFSVEGVCRFRYNFFRFTGKMGFILRIINTQIPTIEELKICPILNKIVDQQRGLILVTGATGSGKTTTLAAMMNRINQTRAEHIITIEDPIEFLHPQIKARISQREIGKDTDNFSSALRSALRQDPDIILVGEMRDPETISTALKAAETGHVVFSTLHTTDAVTSIGRILSMFEANEQNEIKKRLSENLYSIISQRMLRGKKANTSVVAQEILIAHPGIKECILGTEPLSRIPAIIAMGKGAGGSGSQTFDQHLMDLVLKRQITKETAIEAATHPSDFMKQLIELDKADS